MVARLLAFFFAGALYRRTLDGRTPGALLEVPSDPWPGSPERGRTILAEGVSFAPGEGRAGLPEAHDFAWLRDLHALGSDEARARGRALISAWLERYGAWDRAAWRTEVLARRLVHWLRHAAFFAEGAEEEFRAPFLAALARQARHLRRTARLAAPGPGRIAAAKGLVFAGACLPDAEARLAAGLRLLGRELPRQIRPDGGHVQRNPARHLAVLRDLVDIRLALAAARREIPTALENAIDRMAPMLRFFRHGDGGLALFNGGGAEDRFAVDLALTVAEAPGRAPGQAPHSGFQRLSAGETVVIVDTGPPPPKGFERGAHAGTLSFEMSVGRGRVIVNCGPGADPAWRATAAHSTLVVADTNSSEVLPDGRLGRRPQRVACTRREAEGAVWIEASHDGYVGNFGLTHHRRLYLAPGGGDLRGEDRLTGRLDGRPFAVRFHLHPEVAVAEEGGGVTLRLPEGNRWRFQATGGEVHVEESAYVGGPGPARRTRQVVVAGRTAGGGGHTVAGDGDAALVKWALRRQH